ncbi:MAG: FkbM family methyltransferase [Pseudohaliea sp.]
MGGDAIELALPSPPGPLRLRLHPAGTDLVSDRLREARCWEPFETRLCLALMSPGACCVDVGANLGYFTVLAAAQAGPGGRVYAFEPDPANFALLSANVALNGLADRCTLSSLALSDRAGAGLLYLSGDNLGDHQVYPGDGERPAVPIRLARGEEVLGTALEAIDFLKVDTQGSEAAVLAGLLPLLARQSRPPAILVELTPFSLALAGSSGRALVASLATLGLPFWIVDHVAGRLAATEAEALATWCDNVAATPGDRGFMNILIAHAPDL